MKTVMAVEEQAVVGRKAKRSKREERNDKGVKEVRHSGNVLVEGDERIIEKEDVMEENKEKRIKKKKKKEVNMDTEDGDVEGKKEIKGSGVLSPAGDGEGMEDVDRKKKKKEKRKRKGGEVLGEGGVAEKADNKKNKKKKKKEGGDENSARQDSTARKATYSEENAEGVEISGEGCDGKTTEKVEIKKKKKRAKEKTKDHLKDVQEAGHGFDGEVKENFGRKKMKGEKGQTKNDLKGVEIIGEDCDWEDMEKVEREKKKKEKGKSSKDLSAVEQDIMTNKSTFTEGNSCSADNEIQDGDMKTNRKGKRKKTNLEENGSDKPKAKKAKKKVSFSGQVEVFPSAADSESQKSRGEGEELVRGKRFTPKEDETVKEAVYKYIEEHDLGEEGLNMVLNCSSHPEIRDCWNHIATAIPYRPKTAIYYRAQVLFRRGDKRKWTEEEFELIRKHHKAKGNKWKELAEELGKHRFHVKDTWRRIKFQNRKKGAWSQDEYQTLFDLVNTDLQLKLSEEKKNKHGMLRDNIHWTAISEKLSTRPDSTCCMKWYNQLTSPMVAEGLWADADDYRLISKLFSLDASCREDVDWDDLVEGRTGEICRKRWNQMILHIGKHGTKSFAEQVDILAKRYCPHLLEVREDWDSKEALED